MRFIQIYLSLSLYIFTLQCFSEPIFQKTMERCPVYKSPSSKQLVQAKSLFDVLLTEGKIETHSLGFRVTKDKIHHRKILFLSEYKKYCTGIGYYAVDIDKSNKIIPVLLQAPHQFFDLKTGKIVSWLFSAMPFKAAAWNSSHRYYSKLEDSSKSDLAKLANSIFMEFSKSFMRHYANGVILQVHGFNNNNQKTPRGKIANVIISSGQATIEKPASNLARCLKIHIQNNVFLFPSEIGELGATKNALGQWVNKKYPGHFVHLELNYRMRDKFLKDKALRKVFARCIKGMLR